MYLFYYTFKEGFLVSTKPNDNLDLTPVTQEEFNTLLEEAQNKEIDYKNTKIEMEVV